MTTDCQWVEKNLQALFCDELNEHDARLARAHIEVCVSCGNEVRALKAIDPLIRNHFRRELVAAGRQPKLHVRRLFAVTGAVAAAALCFALFLQSRVPGPVPGNLTGLQNRTAVAPAEPGQPSKSDAGAEASRVKPSVNAGAETTDRASPLQMSEAAGAGLEFFAVDAAGYAHTLDEYRGHIVVISVWSPEEASSMEQIERLYKTFGANPKFRFLGVTNERRAKPSHMTFPVLYNKGSNLFGARPGQFVLLDANGAVGLRGSIIKDFERLQTMLRAM